METTRIIERYLDGTLNEEDRRKVEERAGRDPGFHELIRLHREVNESIRDNDLFELNQLIKKVSEQYFTSSDYLLNEQAVQPRNFLYRYFLRIAVMLIFLASGGIILKMTLFNSTSSVKLYHKYYTVYNADVVFRSAQPEVSEQDKAILCYDQGKYADALQLLTTIIQNDPHNMQALFYRGLACLETGNTDCAVTSFREIPDNWNSPYSEHRNWYLALAMLKSDNPTAAADVLREISAANGYYHKQAEQILRKLKF